MQRKGTPVAKPHNLDLTAVYGALMGPATAYTGLNKAGVGGVMSLGTSGV